MEITDDPDYELDGIGDNVPVYEEEPAQQPDCRIERGFFVLDNHFFSLRLNLHPNRSVRSAGKHFKIDAGVMIRYSDNEACNIIVFNPNNRVVASSPEFSYAASTADDDDAFGRAGADLYKVVTDAILSNSPAKTVGEIKSNDIDRILDAITYLKGVLINGLSMLKESEANALELLSGRGRSDFYKVETVRRDLLDYIRFSTNPAITESLVAGLDNIAYRATEEWLIRLQDAEAQQGNVMTRRSRPIYRSEEGDPLADVETALSLEPGAMVRGASEKLLSQIDDEATLEEMVQRKLADLSAGRKVGL